MFILGCSEIPIYLKSTVKLTNFDYDTHGVSSMTLHTLAMVLKQSVVFSIGKFLFCKHRKVKKSSKVIKNIKSQHTMKNQQLYNLTPKFLNFLSTVLSAGDTVMCRTARCWCPEKHWHTNDGRIRKLMRQNRGVGPFWKAT